MVFYVELFTPMVHCSFFCSGGSGATRAGRFPAPLRRAKGFFNFLPSIEVSLPPCWNVDNFARPRPQRHVSSSRRPITHGNEVPTRIRTVYFDSTYPRNSAWPRSPSTTATPSHESSTGDHGNDSTTKRQRSDTCPGQLLHFKLDARPHAV